MIEQHHLNDKVKLFTEAILSAAKEAIPRGRRRDYISGWNAQLQELHSTASRLREKMESCPTDENTAAYNKAKADFTRQKLQQTRAAWHEKTSSLNMEKDTGKLWKLTKLLNGEIPEKAQTVLQSEGEHIVQKEAANCLAKLYQKEGNVKLPRERTCQVREQLAQLQKQPTSHNCMSQPITMKEIEAAIRQLKCKKAPGPDGVTNDVIKQLGPAAKKTLLELFNESWKNGTVPAQWKKATIIPIHKKGKDKKDPNSYRLISLLSCLGKVLERVINRRLISFLEERKMLSPTQTGYWKHRSTEDQLALIAQEIENAFQEKKKVVCFLWPNKSFWQSLARRSPAEDTWERRFWKNVQVDPMFPTQQISQSKTGWPFEQKRENARRSPTGRSHLTDTLSPVHQQHHDCASRKCLQYPTCRWSRCMECIRIHHICLQNPGSCEQGRAVDKWLGSSDQWSEDSGHSFLPFHLQRKSRHKAWRQDTAPSGDSHLSRGKAWHPTLMKATHRGHGEKRHQEVYCPEEIVWNTLGYQLQDSKNRLHGSCPAFSGIWGQHLGDSCQDAHQQTGQSSEHRLEDNAWCHENHSCSWNGEDRWSWTTWGQETGQTSYPCRKDEEDARPLPAPKAQRPHKKTDWKGKVWTT